MVWTENGAIVRHIQCASEYEVVLDNSKWWWSLMGVNFDHLNIGQLLLVFEQIVHIHAWELEYIRYSPLDFCEIASTDL